MNPTRTRRLAAAALTAALLAGCSAGDDEADPRPADPAADPTTRAPAPAGPLVEAAVTGYETYVQEQVEGLVADTRSFTDAVRAGDLAAAKARYPASRTRWERIEPIAGLLADIDGQVDSRAATGVPDSESPEVTGWHQLEYDIWVRGDLSGSRPLADGLDRDLQSLRSGLPDLEIDPLTVAQGATELIEEVAEGKITGEEDRYSHTDLWDLDANVEGAQASSQLLRAAIVEADPELWDRIEAAYGAAAEAMDPYRSAVGWTSFDEVSEGDRAALKAKFSALAEVLGEVPGALQLS